HKNVTLRETIEIDGENGECRVNLSRLGRFIQPRAILCLETVHIVPQKDHVVVVERVQIIRKKSCGDRVIESALAEMVALKNMPDMSRDRSGLEIIQF